MDGQDVPESIAGILQKVGKEGSGVSVSNLNEKEKKELVSYIREESRLRYLDDREQKQITLVKN